MVGVVGVARRSSDRADLGKLEVVLTDRHRRCLQLSSNRADRAARLEGTRHGGAAWGRLGIARIDATRCS